MRTTKKEQDIIDKSNIGQIELAIQIIKDSSEEVTINAISRLTGFSRYLLSRYDCSKQYTKEYKQHRSSKIKSSKNRDSQNSYPITESISVEDNIEGYIQYIKDSHSGTTFEVEQALIQAKCDVIKFNETCFHIAVNKLKLGGLLEKTVFPNKFHLKEEEKIAISWAINFEDFPAHDPMDFPDFDSVDEVLNSGLEEALAESITVNKVEEESEPRLWEYLYPLQGKNNLSISYTSNLNTDDKESIVEYLELIIRSIKRKK
jgi:hypothetical protein